MNNVLTYILNLKESMSGPLAKVGATSVTAKTGIRGLRSEVNALNSTPLSGIGAGFASLIKNIAPMFIFATAIAGVTRAIEESQAANEEASLAENKLSVIMKQRMNATTDQINKILELTGAQQGLGIVEADVQVSGAQQLATFLTQKSSLDKLIPAMNNLIAQQRGYKATAEDATNIGNLIGKVMQGQTSALTRVGITFSKAEGNVLKFGNEQKKAAMLAQIITNNVGNMNAALAATPEGKLKQNANDLNDVQERLGKIIVTVKAMFAPVVELVIRGLNNFIDKLQQYKSQIKEVASLIVNGLIVAMRFLANVVKTVHTGYVNLINGIREGNPVYLALGGAIVYITTLVLAYKTVMGISRTAVMLWTAAQWLLNAAMSLNPIGLIIAGVVALTALIAVLVVGVKGWGAAWTHIVTGAKLRWLSYVEYIKSSFNIAVQSVMIGINKIKEGWYNFKNVLGIGNAAENKKMLSEIHADTEARKKSIVDGVKKTASLAKQSVNEFKMAGGSLSWDSSAFSRIGAGIKNKLGISAPGIPGMNTSLSTDTAGGGDGGGGGKAVKDTANSIATGGAKSTNVTINLKNLVDTININRNGFRESGESMRDMVLDELTRVLSLAQSQL